MKNYFKKFSIMFAMTLTLMLGSCVSVFAATDDGVVGTSNLNGTAENSAVVGKVLNAPEIGWKRYDDSDSRIRYSSKMSSTNATRSWYIGNKNQSYNGTITDSLYGDNSKDESISFEFYGSELRVISPYWSSNTSLINIYIDNELIGDFSELSDNCTLQTLVYEINGLSKSRHSVKIVNQESNGNYFAFDAVDIDKDGYLLGNNESVSLDKSSMDLNTGELQQLIATTTPASTGVTWTSSDSSIATVDSTGKVTGVKEGQATITATTADGLTATCNVTVTNTSGTSGGTSTGTDETSTIVNIAHAKGDNTNNAGGEVSIIFHGTAETTLSVVKTADVKDVWVGDNFTYTIVVTNTGSKTAKAVVVNDTAPNHIQFIPSGITTTQGTVDSTSTPSNIVVNVGDIPPSGTVTIKVPVTVVL